jgi:hypothetical protein
MIVRIILIITLAWAAVSPLSAFASIAMSFASRWGILGPEIRGLHYQLVAEDQGLRRYLVKSFWAAVWHPLPNLRGWWRVYLKYRRGILCSQRAARHTPERAQEIRDAAITRGMDEKEVKAYRCPFGNHYHVRREVAGYVTTTPVRG